MVKKIPLMRAAISGAFDSNQSAQILSVRFDPTESDQNIPGTTGESVDLGTEDLKVSTPIAIYDYRMDIVTDVVCALWQWYCDDEDITHADNWSMTSSTFLQSLKQYKLAPGNITSSENQFTAPVVTTLYYRAKKYWSKKHRMWKWIRPPIILSKNKKNSFGLSIANLSNYHDSRSYYALISIKNWHLLT